MVLINYCEVPTADWYLSEPIKDNNILSNWTLVRFPVYSRLPIITWIDVLKVLAMVFILLIL